MDKVVQQLVEKLQKAYGDRLVSVVLYGSAAGGDRQEKFSDYNVLCVLSRITPLELSHSEAIFRWWRELGSPSPLLLTEQEVETSTDCFAIEFSDMQRQHQVLAGKDVVSTLVVDRTFYRAQVEHDLVSTLLRLRQKAAAVLSDRDALLTLMIDSVSTFCVLLRHALALGGIPAGTKKREIVAHLAGIGIDPRPFEQLLDLREERTGAKDVSPRELFEQYLASIHSAVEYVDRLAK